MLTEKTVDQIIGVLELTEKYFKSGIPAPKAYQRSVNEIAQNYSIKYQTIADGCRRRLGLGNANQFIELLKEWLSGQPDDLRKLLTKHSGESEQYKIDKFFDRTRSVLHETTPPINLEEQFELLSIRIPQNTSFQLRTLAESKRESVQDFANKIIKEFVENNYVEYLKTFLNSLPQKQREQVIAELLKV